MSGLFPTRTSPPAGLTGCAPFLACLLIAAIAIAVIGEACGGPHP